MGILCSVLGSLSSVGGLLLQKLAHNENKGQVINERRIRVLGMYPSDGKWVAGLVLLLIPFGLAAVALAPLSIIAPLFPITIILSQVLAPWVLGESIAPTDWLATALIVLGCALSTVIGDQCSMTYSLDEMRQFARAPAFVISEVAFAVMIAASLVVIYLVIPRYVDNARQDRFCAVGHGFVAGIYAGQKKLLMKGLGETILRALEGQAEGLQDGLFWVFGIATFLLLLVQVIHLNYGLGLLGAVKYLPIFHTSVVLSSILSGLFFFQEYKTITDIGIVAAINAWLIIMIGVLLLVCYEPGEVQQIKLTGKSPADGEAGQQAEYETLLREENDDQA